MDKNSYESTVDYKLANTTHNTSENEHIPGIRESKENNSTDELNVQKPEHDQGVVKITSDNAESAANASQLLQQTTIYNKQNKTKDKQSMYDDSTLNLIEILNSNLTNIQVLLRFLNDRVNSKTIQAIIQSSGTESNDDITIGSKRDINSNEQNDGRNHDSDFNNEQGGELTDNTKTHVGVSYNKTTYMNTSDISNTDETKLCQQCDNSTFSFTAYLENSTLNTTNMIQFSSIMVTNFLHLLCSGIDNFDIATHTIQATLKEIIAKANSSDTSREVEDICKLYKKAITSVNIQSSKFPMEYSKNVLNDGSRHSEDMSLGM